MLGRGMGKGKLPKKILRKVIDLLQAVYFSIFLVIAMTEFDDQILGQKKAAPLKTCGRAQSANLDIGSMRQ